VQSLATRERWNALWQVFGAGAGPIFEQLQLRYAEPHRAYHALEHIADCLAQFDRHVPLAEQPAEVEAALWLHDVIYDPRRRDNEERSMAWARKALANMGIAAPIGERICGMILATKHIEPPGDGDAALLVDIDLSILGRDPETFTRYERAIRQEYNWVAEADFCAGRAALLQKFLARARIYQTDSFHHQYERQARENLAWSLAQLAASTEC
jgi:predicted metal-dependent HD superfamily phosphohydrolase